MRLNENDKVVAAKVGVKEFEQWCRSNQHTPHLLHAICRCFTPSLRALSPPTQYNKCSRSCDSRFRSSIPWSDSVCSVKGCGDPRVLFNSRATPAPTVAAATVVRQSIPYLHPQLFGCVGRIWRYEKSARLRLRWWRLLKWSDVGIARWHSILILPLYNETTRLARSFLVFGDLNQWGFWRGAMSRHGAVPLEDQWPRVLTTSSHQDPQTCVPVAILVST